MTKLEAIKELVTYDHSFLSPETAKKLAEPFGISPNLYDARDTRSQFKGLTLHGINPKTGKEYQEGDTCSGVDADILSTQIANYLKVDYCPMFGRGSQLRETCRAVEEYLTK
jgi:hypothetical protein